MYSGSSSAREVLLVVLESVFDLGDVQILLSKQGDESWIPGSREQNLHQELLVHQLEIKQSQPGRLNNSQSLARACDERSSRLSSLSVSREERAQSVEARAII